MLDELTYRLSRFFHRSAVEAEFEEEFQFHFQQQTELLIRRGLPPDEADRQARLMFGSFEATKEDCYEAQGVSVLDDLSQDLRYAVRLQRKTPLLTACSILVLTVCIGSSVVLSSASYQAVFEGPPVVDSDRLVSLESAGPNLGQRIDEPYSRRESAFSFPMYCDLRDRSLAFSRVLARFSWEAALSREGSPPELVTLEMVSSNYFETLGVSAAVGRVFTEEDDRRPERLPPAVLTYSCWKDRFGGDPSVVGRTVFVNHSPVTIVGVSAEGLHSLKRGRKADVQIPITTKVFLSPQLPETWRRDQAWVRVVARLKPGLSLRQAEIEANKAYRECLELEARAVPAPWDQRERFLKRRIKLRPCRTGVEGAIDVRHYFLPLSGQAAALWIVACASLAALYMMRASARTRELTIRVAIGADRARVARQLFAEGLALALPAALLGLVLASVLAKPALRTLLTFCGAHPFSWALGPQALVFWLAVSILTILWIGYLPRFQPWLAELGRIAGMRRLVSSCLHGNALPLVLVALQLALSIWMTSWALMTSDTRNWERRSDLGFRKENLLSCEIDAFTSNLNREETARVYDRIEQRVAATPGVEAVGGSDIRLVARGLLWRHLEADSDPSGPRKTQRAAVVRVSPGYFQAASYAVVAGRIFSPGDVECPARRGVVNQTFAKKFFGRDNPIGKRVRMAGESSWIQIVGCVRDEIIISHDLQQPLLYVPYRGDGLSYYIRSALPPPRLLPRLREAAKKEAPGTLVYLRYSLDSLFELSIHQFMTVHRVMVGFALIAALLAAVVLAQMVSCITMRRIAEIGVRLTLGATPHRIVSLILRDVILAIIAGCIAGWAWTVGFGHLMAALGVSGYEITPGGQPYVAAAAVILALVGTVAALIPAARAARSAPAISLLAD